MVRVSIIIPCHNLGAYLQEAVDSALAQNYSDFEVLVVDDGSTDPATVALLDRLVADPRLRVFRNANQGVAFARNFGINNAAGEYILPLDADDRILPDYIARSVEVLDAHPEVGFVSCHYRTFGLRETEIRPDAVRLPDMLVINSAPHASVMRRDAWRRAGGYSETMSHMHDWDLWIGILGTGYLAVVIPEIMFEYRVRTGSLYATSSQPEHYSRLVGEMVAAHMELYQRWWREIISLYARHKAELVEYANGQAQQSQERAEWIAELETARDFHAQQAEKWQNEATYWQTEATYWRTEAENWRAKLAQLRREYFQVPRSRVALRRLVRRKG